jgi:hypothetical protein
MVCEGGGAGGCSSTTPSKGAWLVLMPANSAVTNTGAATVCKLGEVSDSVVEPPDTPVMLASTLVWPGAMDSNAGLTLAMAALDVARLTVCVTLSALERVIEKLRGTLSGATASGSGATDRAGSLGLTVKTKFALPAELETLKVCAPSGASAATARSKASVAYCAATPLTANAEEGAAMLA